MQNKLNAKVTAALNVALGLFLISRNLAGVFNNIYLTYFIYFIGILIIFSGTFKILKLKDEQILPNKPYGFFLILLGFIFFIASLLNYKNNLALLFGMGAVLINIILGLYLILKK